MRRAPYFCLAVVVLAALCAVPAATRAQSVASLTGTVTDTTGAAVPGASVTLLNTRTNASFFGKTASDGSYRITDVAPGPGYALTVKKDGFQIYIVNNLYMPVATATTQDVKLTLGTLAQTIEVTAAGSVTLNTTNATIGHTLDNNAISNLPDEFRDNPGNLLRLETGVVSAQVNAGQAKAANLDPNFTRDGSVAGARADQNNIVVDGIDATDFRSGQAFTIEAAIPLDAVQEFSTQVAQPTAEYGGRGGSQTVITTKSGTNTWHGSLFEYNRNAATEANTYFNATNNPVLPRLALVRNQFGGNVGGPVLKDKLFFFFEYDDRRDASALSELQFVPYPHVQKGEIAYINDSGGAANPCPISSRLTAADVSTACVTIAPAAEVISFDPCSTTACTSQGFVQAGPAPVLLNAFKNRYPAANDFNVGDGLNIAGLRFNASNPVKEKSYLGRVDYNLSGNNKMFGRFNIINETAINLSNGNLPVQFPGDPLTSLFSARNRAWVIGDTWTVNSNMINQLTLGETRANDQFPIAFNGAGAFYELSFFGAFQGSTFATPFERQTSQGDVVPEPTIRDDYTWTHGKHTLQFGGQWNPAKVRSGLTNDFVFVQEGLGGAVTGLDSTSRPADILAHGPDVATAANLWDNFFMGDLGIIWNSQTAINYTGAGNPLPLGSPAARDWRINELAGYAQDTWRIRGDLTATLGVRYQFQAPPWEVHGTEAQFFNTNFNAIVNARLANGLAGISGPNATPLLTYNLAGQGANGPSLYKPEYHDFSPRIGLAWNPSFNGGVLGSLFGDRKTVVRAGGALIYDESVIYAITNFEDQSNYLFGNTVAVQFNTGQPTDFAIENDPRMNSLSAAPYPVPPPPFQTPLTPGAIFNDGIDPNLKTPYSIAASLGIQRELPGGFQLEVDYYGRFGRLLMQLGDVSQAMDFTDPTPDHQSLVNAFSIVEKDTRSFNDAATAATSIPQQPFFETNMNAALGAAGPCATFFAKTFAKNPGVPQTCTAAAILGNFGALQNGATGEIVASLPFPQNVGLTPQFFVDALMANKGYSSYNSMFTTLRKRLSHNLQFDLNYTLAHSIDNGSTVANENGNFQSGVTSVMCDVTNLRACRGNSEFDVRHAISGDFVYDLPFGRGQTFGRSAGWLLNEVIGGWAISGIETWRTGLAFTVNNTAFATFDTVSLAADTGMLFTGTQAQVRSNVHVAGGQVQFFANPVAAASAFSPVTGLQSGNRDTLHGPHFSNLDVAVSKNFPIVNERYRLQFRAEAYNVFNHANFGLPDTGAIDSNFGQITGLAGQEPSRVMQFALRFDF
jgi:carboxypeptidase family protein